jgi:formylglycine-generating enzyme required for sulfatase activity
MGALASAVRTRHDHHTRLVRARSTSDELFQILRDEAFYERPIAERHRVIFYLGHVEAFDWNLLGQRAFGLKRFHRTFDQLFAFGIDPVGGGLPTDQPSDWPSREEIRTYNDQIRSALDNAIEQALEHPAEGHPQLLSMLDSAIEHRLMHAETLAYMFHQLALDRKKPLPVESPLRTRQIEHRLVDIPEGPATLGLPKNDQQFGWDNERAEITVDVPAFSIENHNVTNRQFMHFVERGGYFNRSLWRAADWTWREKNRIEHPAFWARRGNIWTYRGMFSELPLPMDYPAYVSHAEASAYANGWTGNCRPKNSFTAQRMARQIRRAAKLPVGEAPNAKHGNFDFMHWDPSPCGSHPEGASAFGVHDLVGNGWEWTRGVRAASGLAQCLYPGYSANFLMGTM